MNSKQLLDVRRFREQGERVPHRTKNVILFIGDGMGAMQRTAGRWHALGVNGRLLIDKMPVCGWADTASANDPVTDSAAAATALATGRRTHNGVIAQSPDGERYTTILERAKAQGMAVGLVTTVPVAHATPAAFAAHVADRYQMREIARQLIEAELDVLLGGGEEDFLPNSVVGHYAPAGTRWDGRNLIEEAVAAGYHHAQDASTLRLFNPQRTPRLLGLFGKWQMLPPYTPTLKEMMQAALHVLSQNPRGFFLMVESGQVDWAGHENNLAGVIENVLALDEAVRVAQTFAARQRDTLLIVTADHETGGMSVHRFEGALPEAEHVVEMPDGTPFYATWTTGGHTPTPVPTTAMGPRAHLLRGSYPNTYIHDVMRVALRDNLIRQHLEEVVAETSALPQAV